MSTQKATRAPLILALLVVIALAGGFVYYYSVSSSALSSNSTSISSLSSQASYLQGQVQARSSISVVTWLASSSDTGNTYQVRVTNNNYFDITLTQLTLNVMDHGGNQVASNTIAPQIVVAAGASVTTTISIAPRSSSSGATISAIFSTPYGQITV